jgi:hypothetical protein
MMMNAADCKQIGGLWRSIMLGATGVRERQDIVKNVIRQNSRDTMIASFVPHVTRKEKSRQTMPY